MHGGFGFGVRNAVGMTLLDFEVAFGLVVTKSLFKNRESHLVTINNNVVKTQIDYFFLRLGEYLFIDCKVLPI